MLNEHTVQKYASRHSCWGSRRDVSSLQAGWGTISPLIAQNLRLREKKHKSFPHSLARSVQKMSFTGINIMNYAEIRFTEINISKLYLLFLFIGSTFIIA